MLSRDSRKPWREIVVQTECEVCGVRLNSQDQWESHQKGEKHRKAMKRWEEKQRSAAHQADGSASVTAGPVEANAEEVSSRNPNYCEICEKQMTSAEQLRAHLDGSSHRKKEKAKQLERQSSSSSAAAAEGSRGGSGNIPENIVTNGSGGRPGLVPVKAAGKDPLHCHVCNFTASSFEHLEDHMHGKKHQKKLQASADPSAEYYCAICKVAATSREGLEDHTRGKQHQKNASKTSSTTGLDFYCQVCKIQLTGEEQFEQHQGGKSHIHKCQELGISLPASVRNKLPTARRHPGALNLEVGDEPKFLTATSPRDYQEELYKQALNFNRVLYLPTGMGKTLLGTCVLSRILQLNPSYQVVFLVDRVILVVQQARAIRHELAEVRLSGDRPVRVAALCGGKEDLEENMPPGSGYQHDIVVATAGCYRNYLEKKILFWNDISCLVIDEVHHCGKRHPFHTILQEYYQEGQHKPRLVGLTASPAGQLNVAKTMKQLTGLLERMSAKLGTVINSRKSYTAFLRRAELRCSIVHAESSHIDETQLAAAMVRHDDAEILAQAQAAGPIEAQPVPSSSTAACAAGIPSAEEHMFEQMLQNIQKYLEEALRTHSGCSDCGRNMAELSELLAIASEPSGSVVRDTMVTILSMTTRKLSDEDINPKCQLPLQHFQTVARSWLDLKEHRCATELKKLSDNEWDYSFKRVFPKQLKSEVFIRDYLSEILAIEAASEMSRMKLAEGEKNLSYKESKSSSDDDLLSDYMYTCEDESDDDEADDLYADLDDNDSESASGPSDSDDDQAGDEEDIDRSEECSGAKEVGERSEELKQKILEKIVDELLKLPWTKEPRPIALVLVEKRKEAVETMEALNEDARLSQRNIRALQIIGQGNTPDTAGMSVKKQSEAMAALHQGTANVAVCTSVAEEGLDLPSCSLVIRTKLPRTVPSLVQSWGRARACGATFFVICENLNEQEKVHGLLAREKNMEQVATQLVAEGKVQ